MDIYNREVILTDGTKWFVTRRLSSKEWIGKNEKKERAFSFEDIADVVKIETDARKGPWI